MRVINFANPISPAHNASGGAAGADGGGGEEGSTRRGASRSTGFFSRVSTSARNRGLNFAERTTRMYAYIASKVNWIAVRKEAYRLRRRRRCRCRE